VFTGVPSVTLGEDRSSGATYVGGDMQPVQRELTQPLGCRIWNPLRKCFDFTDRFGQAEPRIDRWSGLFDRRGAPLYERDIIQVHYDWRLGWVSALVVRHPKRADYAARATDPEGKEFYIGSYYFADSYLSGNLHQTPGKLKRATEQFPEEPVHPWWLSDIIFRRSSGLQQN